MKPSTSRQSKSLPSDRAAHTHRRGPDTSRMHEAAEARRATRRLGCYNSSVICYLVCYRL